MVRNSEPRRAFDAIIRCCREMNNQTIQTGPSSCQMRMIDIYLILSYRCFRQDWSYGCVTFVRNDTGVAYVEQWQLFLTVEQKIIARRLLVVAAIVENDVRLNNYFVDVMTPDEQK